jgi:hypothetical protein
LKEDKEIMGLLKVKGAKREEAEKVEQPKLERLRNLMGQVMKKAREQLEIEEPKHDAMRCKEEKAKKEKQELGQQGKTAFQTGSGRI